MSLLLAKKASLNLMRECQGNNCSCFTNRGYYIQYRSGNAESMLFVCEDCFIKQYKSRCTFGSFDEGKYQHSVKNQRYHLGNPILRKTIKVFRSGVHYSRIACVLLSVLLITAFCIKEKPQIRDEPLPHNVYCQINSDFRGFDNVIERMSGTKNRIAKVITHVGGINNDK